MNTKLKSALVLLGTLVLGIVIGVLVQTAVHNQRMETARSLRNRGALSDVIERVVKPRNEEQAEEIRALVNRYEAKLSEMLRESWKTRGAEFDSMRQALIDSVLFDDQVTALDEWRERNRHQPRSGNTRREGSRREKGDRSKTN